MSSDECRICPQPYFQQIFWPGIVTGPMLSSAVFPASLSRTGLPSGGQAVGNAIDDDITIDFTRLLAEEIGGSPAPPTLSDKGHGLDQRHGDISHLLRTSGVAASVGSTEPRQSR